VSHRLIAELALVAGSLVSRNRPDRRCRRWSVHGDLGDDQRV